MTTIEPIDRADSPRPPRDLYPAREHRREPRIPTRRPVEILPCEGSGGFVVIELLDCSVHGVSLLLGRPLKVGQDFMLRIQLAETNIVLYTVRNCGMVCEEPESYRIGAEFAGYVAASPDVRRQSIVDMLICGR